MSTDEVELMDTSEAGWLWYYLADCGHWHQFEGDWDNPFDSHNLEQCYTRNSRGVVRCTASNGTICVDFNAMLHKDSAGKEREIKRHVNIERSCSCFTAAPVFWDSVDPASPFQLITLNSLTEEYNQVACYVENEGLLNQSIVSITRIQNLDLWELYHRKKKQLMRIHKVNDIQERRLFHGTDVKNVEAICKYNFDLRLAKEYCSYGRGIYFSRSASLAHIYSWSLTNGRTSETYCYIILARVMTGKSTLGQITFCKPDQGSLENEHNSCVDNIDHPKIFVIFDPNQIYPEYLIECHSQDP